jgi:hypothetical protein
MSLLAFNVSSACGIPICQDQSYLCISPAVPLKLRHEMTIIVVINASINNRGRVIKCQTALEGGSRAFVDFQVMPPFGMSISTGRQRRRRALKSEVSSRLTCSSVTEVLRARVLVISGISGRRRTNECRVGGRRWLTEGV